jgi:hypothetical protein
LVPDDFPANVTCGKYATKCCTCQSSAVPFCTYCTCQVLNNRCKNPNVDLKGPCSDPTSATLVKSLSYAFVEQYEYKEAALSLNMVTNRKFYTSNIMEYIFNQIYQVV